MSYIEHFAALRNTADWVVAQFRNKSTNKINGLSFDEALLNQRCRALTIDLIRSDFPGTDKSAIKQVIDDLSPNFCNALLARVSSLVDKYCYLTIAFYQLDSKTLQEIGLPIIMEFIKIMAIASEQDPDNGHIIRAVFSILGASNSFLDKIFYPSGRFKTSMRLFQVPFRQMAQGIKLNSNDDVLLSQEYLNITQLVQSELFLPVVRYGSGMRRGIFYPDADDKINGTYYYYEPHSPFYLKTERTLITQNKITAFCYLSGQDYRNHTSSILSQYGETYLSTYISIVARYNNLQEYVDDLYLAAHNQPCKYNFLEFDRKLYSLNDPLDRLIFQKGKDQNIDVIILTTETGSSRVVTEIYDLRDRTASFDNIYSDV